MSEQIFISYRREGGNATALNIYNELKKSGLNVFYDHESILSENYKERIREAIENCVDFVLILTPHALDRRETEEDWLYIEIALALKNKKNIVAVKDPYFKYPETLPKEIEELRYVNNVPLYFDYFDAAIDKIIRFLKSRTPLEPYDDPSEGLKYKLNDDETGYTVARGDCDDSEITIPGSYKGMPVTDIGFVGFANRGDITSIRIPDSVKKIHNYAFGKCTSLTEVNLPDNLKLLGDSVFMRCTKLAQINIPSSLNHIANELFMECESLDKIVIPDKIKSIGERAFAGCTSLQEITFGSGVKTIQNEAFIACCSLTEITLPDGIQKIGSNAFTSCENLIKINLPNSITEIGGAAFNFCLSLTEIELPEGIQSIEENTFSECFKLEQIKIPESVYLIRETAFALCESLVRIDLPGSIRKIGTEAFWGCSSLTDIHFGGTVSQWQRVNLGANCFPEHITVIRCFDGDYHIQ